MDETSQRRLGRFAQEYINSRVLPYEHRHNSQDSQRSTKYIQKNVGVDLKVIELLSRMTFKSTLWSQRWVREILEGFCQVLCYIPGDITWRCTFPRWRTCLGPLKEMNEPLRLLNSERNKNVVCAPRGSIVNVWLLQVLEIDKRLYGSFEGLGGTIMFWDSYPF